MGYGVLTTSVALYSTRVPLVRAQVLGVRADRQLSGLCARGFGAVRPPALAVAELRAGEVVVSTGAQVGTVRPITSPALTGSAVNCVKFGGSDSGSSSTDPRNGITWNIGLWAATVYLFFGPGLSTVSASCGVPP